MLRLAVVLCLLWPAAAFAGQARGQFQVGIIITGKGSASTIKPKTGAKNAAVASPAQTATARIGSPVVRRKAAPAAP